MGNIGFVPGGHISIETSNNGNTGGERLRITASGDIGVNESNPGARLHVAGNVKIVDGTQGAGKVLTSDANGLASWQVASGDSLGSHIATTTLNMAGHDISNVSTITVNGRVGIGTANPGVMLDVAGNVNISGDAKIARYPTQAADSGVTLTSADFGKTITVSASGPQTVTLPSVSASDIGAQVTVVKLGIGQVTIQVTGSGVTIADSNPGGNITNNVSGENYASITLRLVTDMKWVITGGNGSWTTN